MKFCFRFAMKSIRLGVKFEKLFERKEFSVARRKAGDVAKVANKIRFHSSIHKQPQALHRSNGTQALAAETFQQNTNTKSQT